MSGATRKLKKDSVATIRPLSPWTSSVDHRDEEVKPPNGHGVARPRTGELDDTDDRFAGTEPDSGMVPIQMEGDGPLVLREKVHAARPMTIDQALLEMELVGHDFFLFHDSECDRFSVVYRRRGYDYGVIRLVEE